MLHKSKEPCNPLPKTSKTKPTPNQSSYQRQKHKQPHNSRYNSEFQKLSPTPTPETGVAQKLSEAENIGTIKKILINKDDTPAYAWKSQIPPKNFPPQLAKNLTKMNLL